MKKGLTFFLMLLITGLGLFSKVEHSYSAAMDYSVKANIPENQINKNLSYFDLQMRPGSIQKVSLTVKNNSKEELEIMIEPNTAITNQNGVIDYSKHDYKKDSTLKNAFSDIISDKQKVVLKGDESKKVFFTIQMPKKSFDGIILGGFNIYRTDIKNETKKSNNIQVENVFSYVIGVKLSETDEVVFPKLKLNKVNAGLMNYRTVITANLQNTEAVIINNLDVSARITKEGKKKQLHATKKTNLSMAPNSNFDFPINWDNQKLDPGKYHLYLTATNGDQTWEFDKMFEIKDTDANAINKSAVDLEKDYTLLYIGIALTILAVMMLIIILLRKKKRGEHYEE